MKPELAYGTPIFLVRILLNNRKIPFSKWIIVINYFFKSILMLPCSLWEHLFLSGKIRNTEIKQTPVFVIGHYRSGTTYLHKVLTADPRWKHITMFDFLFPYIPRKIGSPLKTILTFIIKVFRIQNPHFNNYGVNLDDPLEEDMITISSLTPYSAFWGEVFPRNAMKYFNNQVPFPGKKEKEEWKKGYLYLLKKLTFRKKGWLLLKNPPNTGRIHAIRELFPNAKFIFIYRNPYQVYYSSVSLWKRTLEKHYALQKISDKERDEIIFEYYTRLLQQYENDKKLVPKENLVEVRYEDFEKEPFEEARRIYKELRIPGFDEASKFLKEQVQREKYYKKYSYHYNDEIQDKVYEKWHYFINKWGYEKLRSA